MAIVTTPFQRLRRFAPRLIAATVFGSGVAGIYYVSSVPSTPVGSTIIQPRDNSTITVDADGCDNGITTDVTVRTNALDGQHAILTVNGMRAAEAEVATGIVTFAGVKLGTVGTHTLVVKIGGSRAVSAVNVACEGHVLCRMLGPTWDPTAPQLNGLPVERDSAADPRDESIWTSKGSDRVSSSGSPYQYRLDLITPIPAGAIAEVHVDGEIVGTATKRDNGNYIVVAGVPIAVGHLPQEQREFVERTMLGDETAIEAGGGGETPRAKRASKMRAARLKDKVVRRLRAELKGTDD